MVRIFLTYLLLLLMLVVNMFLPLVLTMSLVEYDILNIKNAGPVYLGLVIFLLYFHYFSFDTLSTLDKKEDE